MRTRFTRRTLDLAFIKTVPVMAGYIVLGIGFGILLAGKGYGPVWAFLMSALIYAGSMQYVGVGLIAVSASLLSTFLTTLIVNARHLFYSISMIDLYSDAGRKKPYMIFALTDETYSLLCDGQTPEDTDPQTYRFLVSLLNHLYWILGSLMGSILGNVLPFDTTGIDFSMTALFVATFVEQWTTRRDHLSALTGVGASLLALLLFGPDRFLIPAMLMITFVLLILNRVRERRKM
ncbi:MAG: AzlC family ABC transporter permease [Clostridia bacterium]|nr:AzlC family ABC transporter permease [Clostridia bacterium]